MGYSLLYVLIAAVGINFCKLIWVMITKFIEKQEAKRINKIKEDRIAKEAIVVIINSKKLAKHSVKRMRCGCEIGKCICKEYALGTQRMYDNIEQ
jgi:hypothetical protein